MNMIEVSHLNKKYGNFTAVKDISFHVREGELFGFLGIKRRKVELRFTC